MVKNVFCCFVYSKARATKVANMCSNGRSFCKPCVSSECHEDDPKINKMIDQTAHVNRTTQNEGRRDMVLLDNLDPSSHGPRKSCPPLILLIRHNTKFLLFLLPSQKNPCPASQCSSKVYCFPKCGRSLSFPDDVKR